jgi:hypothetical protein
VSKVEWAGTRGIPVITYRQMWQEIDEMGYQHRIERVFEPAQERMAEVVETLRSNEMVIDRQMEEVEIPAPTIEAEELVPVKPQTAPRRRIVTRR